jgi:hypothetical protein
MRAAIYARVSTTDQTYDLQLRNFINILVPGAGRSRGTLSSARAARFDRRETRDSSQSDSERVAVPSAVPHLGESQKTRLLNDSGSSGCNRNRRKHRQTIRRKVDNCSCGMGAAPVENA